MKDKRNRGPLFRLSPFKRKCIQLYAALLYNCNLRGFASGKIYQGNAKRVCVPGLNCYSCPGAVGACPLGSLQSALAKQDHSAFFYVFGMLGLFALLLGRTICGWLCPVGLIQELIHKIPTPKIRKSKRTRMFSWLKYAVLAVTVLLIPLLAGDPGFCKYICPAGTMEGAGGLLLNSANTDLLALPRIYFTNKLIVFFILFMLCVFMFRAFCRFICPLGALYSFFNRISPVGVRVDKEKCTACGACVRKCGMDVKHVGDRECINCGECIDACAAGAITLRAGKIILLGNETLGESTKSEATEPEDEMPGMKGGASVSGCRHTMKKRSLIAWGIALLILAGATVYFNFFDKSVEFPDPDAYVLSEESIAPDFSVGQMDMGMPGDGEKTAGAQIPDSGKTFVLSQHRGQVVVINFWATWCGPCCRELPYFDQLQKQYGEDVYVLCIHHSIETHDVEEFIRDEGLPEELNYARDIDNAVWAVYGMENDALPRTVIIDREGKVAVIRNGSVDSETLNGMVEPLLKGL